MATFFTHLHCHSNFSLLDGVTPIPHLLERAAALDMTHLALTDHNTISGSVEFYEMAQERGITPILGSEVTLDDGTSIVLLVKNAEGYANLCQLLTEGHLKGGHGNFLLSEKTIWMLHRGLIVLSGGKRGRITDMLSRRRVTMALDECHHWKSVFGKDFYLEMQWYNHEDTLLNYKINDLSLTSGVGIVATNDVHFATPGEASLRTIVTAIDKNTTRELAGTVGSPEQYMKSPVQMHTLFRKYPRAVQATEWIVRQCEFEYTLGKPVFPTLDLPQNMTAGELLRTECYAGIKTRYGTPSTDALRRLDYELNTIISMGFTEYFLIVLDIVRYCRDHKIPCVGRGSAGDSLVAYVLGITQVDPVKYNLYFERFLNPERREPPDIDLDLCWKRRDEVIDYVYEKYGHSRTAMICTFTTFAMRSAVADVAKVYGCSEEEARSLTKHLPHHEMKELDKALTNTPECKDHQLTNGIYKDVIADAQKIAGYPRHRSVHPGGIIIAPDKITRFTALEESGKGIIVSHHDMYSIEKLGLVKMDLLGVRGLSILADCMRDLRLPGLDHIPVDDTETFNFIRSGKTIGCFQLESPAMRGLLRKMQIHNLEDVIVAVALIRPGPAEGGMKDAYIRRRAGLEKPTYPASDLEPILGETYGILVYQEQVLQVASAVAGFSYAEADLLRRAMTKSRTKSVMDEIRVKFLRGALHKGTTPETAERVWDLLSHFVGYGFNKAHSATYGLLAYQSAYLKLHYPAPFMAAVLNNGGGFYDAAEYVEECRRLGLAILPPDVNSAEEGYTWGKQSIRVGLGMVKELTQKTLTRIIEQRKQKRFSNFFDFVTRCCPGETELINLIKCGAVWSFEESEPLLLTRTKIYFRNKRNTTMAKLLTEGLYLPPYPLTRKVGYELEILGQAVSAHPLTLFSNLLVDPGITPAADVENWLGRRIAVAGWLVTSRRVPVKNSYMKFLTLEDPSGIVEAVLFPSAYQRFGSLLKTRGPYVVTGTVQSRVPGEVNLIIDRLHLVRDTSSDSTVSTPLPEEKRYVVAE